MRTMNCHKSVKWRKGQEIGQVGILRIDRNRETESGQIETMIKKKGIGNILRDKSSL